MNRNYYKVKGRLIAALIAAIITACVVSGTVFATNAGSGNAGSNKSTTTSTPNDTDSDLLSSQDWNVLLNMSSEDSSQLSSEVTPLTSPLGNGTGRDSIFIWGCIAVGIGILGIAFFIYSQFIYKNIKKPVENNQAGSVENTKETPAIPKRGNSYQEQIINDQSDQNDTKNTQEQFTNSNSNKEEVDWDKFFEEHKNQNHKDD